MIRLAILDDLLTTQIQETGQGALGDMELVWSGTQLSDFLGAAASRKPQVVVINVDLANPENPGSVVKQVKEETGAELIIALYSFLRRSELDEISQHGRPVRSPISLSRLRSQMLGVVVRSLFDGSAGSEPARRPRMSSMKVPERRAEAPRFTRSQLARLMEIQSAVDCECPNHLGEIVAGLQAFEDYAARCENKNPKDAEVHQMLANTTAKARTVMEDALAALIEHEQIVL